MLPDELSGLQASYRQKSCIALDDRAAFSVAGNEL